MITFLDIKNNTAIRTYIQKADEALATQGFTEHSFAHVTKVSQKAQEILLSLGYSQREAELARIAGYLHDIGNIVNRIDHAQSGAVMAFRILDNLGMDPAEIATIIGAIGNHDESTAVAGTPVAAALILADKTDVRRSRVRNKDAATFDIHDRVNYAVEQSTVALDLEAKTFTLTLMINTQVCAVMDYFEIFLQRMILCRKAASYLGLTFKLVINGSTLI